MITAVQARPRSSRPEHSRQLEADRDIARAEDDYRRLRAAYVELARTQHSEVALAMVGADMDRAHAALQSLSGLRRLPFTNDGFSAPRRLAEERAPLLEGRVSLEEALAGKSDF